MADEIDGAMQHAPQPPRQSIIEALLPLLLAMSREKLQDQWGRMDSVAIYHNSDNIERMIHICM